MIKQIEIKVLPDKIEDEKFLHELVLRKVKLPEHRIKEIQLVRKSVDARGYAAKFVLRYDVYIDEVSKKEDAFIDKLTLVKGKEKALIIGAGPAGYFAALELIARGIVPVILDRGKDVQARRRDLRGIQQFGIVNPDSNYCFGEGGAGTYSDGKLYTRSLKRGN